ncbi:hypothetical protein [Acinetobacter lwoffii]|uniref:hypothetical protein n=1 Tax=Acinetobacter lwoffii TaxID=28090 RepID=UPI0002CDC77A|nr:hypothetical protein [Acinetobacter lwoffii]ENW29398.1 hypothetical protein F924_00963 [Acinetobacter lwoffii ATCC 9957 = CIP 70.31]
MSDFEKWFEDQDFYTNMRFIHGDKLFDRDGDVYRVLPVQMVYQGWNTQRQRSKDEFVAITQEWHTKGWNARQGEIDELKAQLNNMETCYIEKKKERDELQNRLKAVYGLSRMRAAVISSWKREELSIKVRKAISHLVKKEQALRGAND